MSLVTIEVEINHGRIISRGSETLPKKGTGLLTLVLASTTTPVRSSVSDFIGKWAGAFSLPEPSPDDPRFAYLIGNRWRS